MKYQELVILLPCHSLEDFPTHHDGEQAESLLASWTALWHPALLASAGKMPKYARSDDPPEEIEGRLLIYPDIGQSDLPTGFVQRAKESGARFIRRKSDREEILRLALENLARPGEESEEGDPPAGYGEVPVDADLAADFMALGYAFLMVKLLMRYGGNLDETYFQQQVAAGALAAVRGENEQAKTHLSTCFDLLSDERKNYYSVDLFLLDLVLIADTTLGASLQTELFQGTPKSLMISGELVNKLAAEHPQTLEQLKQRIAAEEISIVGGEEVERPLALVSPETLLAELQRGRETYQRHLGTSAKVYGRRRAGLTPILPQVLHRCGFSGVLHATMEEGKYPQGMQGKIHWEAADGESLPAIAKPPRDADRPETFLSLAQHLSDSIDHDFVAAVCLAHWPGQCNLWLDALRRIARYGAPLGNFVTLDYYFRQSEIPSQSERFRADQYKTPTLQQSVIRRQTDPISTVQRYWQMQAAASAGGTLAALAALVSGNANAANLEDVAALQDKIDLAAEQADAPELNEQAAAFCESSVKKLAELLPREKGQSEQGRLIFNPHSFARRVFVETPELATPPAVEKPVYAVGQHEGKNHAVVDLPPLGYVWLTGSGKPAAAPGKKTLPLAEEGVLRNEFFEARVNPVTGALQAIHEYKTRGNRLSQQLAFRFADAPIPRNKEDETGLYTVMAAEEVAVTLASTAAGEITSRGRLLNQQGENIADFLQRVRVVRGSRILQFEIEITPHCDPEVDPWNSYYACRFAWGDEAAELKRSVCGLRETAGTPRFEAPLYVEIEHAQARTAILTAGLPYHRRISPRKLDTLLLVRGERTHRFRLGVGIDSPYPANEAIGFLTPPTSIAQTALPPASSRSGWLFHINSRNVLATWWQPLVEEGKVAGYQVRLQETAGRPAECRLSSFRAVASAMQVDFSGKTLANCEIADGAVQFELSAHGWTEIVARWA